MGPPPPNNRLKVDINIDIKRDPNDNSRSKDRLEYYTWLAKTAERGKISSIFFADVYSPHEVYGGNGDASYRGGSQIARLDPTLLVSAMAQVTKSVCFGITGSTSYIRTSSIYYFFLLCKC